MADQPTQGTRLAPGGAYGDRKEMAELQGNAPMAGTPEMPSPPPITAAMLPGLTDPTGLPDEPVTAGAPLGAGPGPAEAGILNEQQITDEQMRPYVRSMQLLANSPQSNAEVRSMVRLMKARLARG